MSDNGRSNDSSADDLAPRSDPDAHGQAALLLVESILHVLIEAKSLSIEQALSAVETASEVKVDLAAEINEAPRTMQESLRLLSRISQSLVTVTDGGAQV